MVQGEGPKSWIDESVEQINGLIELIQTNLKRNQEGDWKEKCKSVAKAIKIVRPFLFI